MKRWLSNLLVLAGSSAKLICCVIPALLVSLGLGATLVSLVDTIPLLASLSEYKWEIFAIAGLLLIYNHKMLQKQICAIDDSTRCNEVMLINKRIHYFAVTLYGLSLLFNLFVLIFY